MNCRKTLLMLVMTLIISSNYCFGQSIGTNADSYGILSGGSISSNNFTVRGKVGASDIISSSLQATDLILPNGSGTVPSALTELSSKILDIQAMSDIPINSVLQNQTLTSGVYSVSGNAELNGILTLTGTANSIFIFKIQDTLIIKNGSDINLNAVLPKNIFWVVDKGIVAENDLIFFGNILSNGNVFFEGTGGEINILSQGNVTINNTYESNYSKYIASHDLMSISSAPNMVCNGPIFTCNLIQNPGLESGGLPSGNEDDFEQGLVDCWDNDYCGVGIGNVCSSVGHSAGSNTPDILDINFSFAQFNICGAINNSYTSFNIPTSSHCSNNPALSPSQFANPNTRYATMFRGEAISATLAQPLKAKLYLIDFWAKATDCLCPNQLGSANMCFTFSDSYPACNTVPGGLVPLQGINSSTWEHFYQCIDLTSVSPSTLNNCSRTGFRMTMDLPTCQYGSGRVTVDDFSLLEIADAGPDKSICLNGDPSSVILGPPCQGPNLTYTYTWTPATGLSNTTIANPIANPQVTTTYTLEVTVDWGSGSCTDFDEVTVTVSNGITLSSSFTPSTGSNGTATVNVLSGTPNYNYLWSTGSTTTNTNQSANTISGLSFGTFTVTVTDANGCSSIETITIPSPCSPESFCRIGTNFVYNHDFNLGNTGFSSSHVYTVPIPDLDPDEYFITNGNASIGNNFWYATDNIAPFTNYMIINGEPDAPTYTWEQTISSLIPNQGYVFCFYATNLIDVNAGFPNYIDPTLTVEVRDGNGILFSSQQFPQLFKTNNANLGLTVWTNFTSAFVNPSGNTAVTIRIHHEFPPLVLGGLDYALQDLYLGETSNLNVTISPNPVALCSGDQIQLVANVNGGTSPITFQWFVDGTLINGATNSSFIVSHVVTSQSIYNYSVVVTDNNSCTSTTNAIVTVNPAPTPQVNPVNPTICQGQSIGLNASNVYSSYQWYLNNIIINGATSQVYSTGTGGSYSVIVTNQFGCTGTSSTILTVTPQSTATISGSPTICSGNTATLTINFTGTGPWVFYYNEGPNTIGPILSNTNSYQLNVSPTTTSIYTLSNVTGNGCPGSFSGSATVNVITQPGPTIIGDLFACTTNPVYSVIPQPNENYIWTFSWTGASISGITTGNLIIPQGGGTITCTVINSITDCRNSVSITIYPCCKDNGVPDLNGFSASYIINNLSVFPYMLSNGSTLEFLGTYTSISSLPIYASPTDIIINGTFIVDNDMVISGSRVIMGPGARIVVTSGAELDIERSLITGCGEYMWEGIDVLQGGSIWIQDSRFEDGISAVTCKDGAVFRIGESYFDRNWVGISLKTYSGISQGYVRNCYFGCIDINNLPIDDCIEPHLNRRGNKGIEVIDNLSVIIGDNTVPGYLNTFRNLDVGIHSVRSNVTILNNHFEDITRPVPPINDGLLHGFAIYAVGNNPSQFNLTVGGTGANDKNIFLNCGNGIFCTRNMSTSIVNNSFNGIRNLVSGTTRSNAVVVEQAITSQVIINNNQFDNCGFFLYGNTSGINTGHGVLIRDLNNSNIEISNNIFNTLIGSNGNIAIRAENNGMARPIPNITSITANLILNSRVGVSTRNYSNAVIDQVNTIHLPDYVPNTGRTFGVRFENSTLNIVDGNEILRAGTPPNSSYDMNVWGVSCETSSGNFFFNNNIRRLGAGFRFYNTGSNTVQCNFLELDRQGVRIVNSNLGNQGFSGQGQDNSWNYGTTTINAILGQGPNYFASFWYTQFNPPFLPIPGTVIPANIPTTMNPWITFISAPASNSCTNPQRVQQQEKMALIALGQDGFYLLSIEEQYKLQKEVFLAIHFDQEWLNLNTIYDQILSDFYEVMLASPMGQLRGAQDIIDSDKEQAKIIINSIAASNSSEENEKTVLKIYINYIENNQVLNTEEKIVLEDIASQNPLFNGVAVYWARFLAELDFEDTYLDPEFRIMQTELKEQYEINCRVYPNPVKGQLTIELNQSEEANLYLYNSMGQITFSKNLHQGINIFNTFEIGLTNGLYTYEIESGQKNHRGKIAIMN